MNRRVLFLVSVLAVAGFFVVHGAFSQQTTSTALRRAINLPDRSPEAAFSNAILVGNTLYMSGNIGFDPKTHKPPEKIEDEIINLMTSYKKLLDEAGFTMDDLVYVQISCTDLSYYEKFNAIYKSYFSRELPARQFVSVSSILGGGHFEMQAIAVKHKPMV